MESQPRELPHDLITENILTRLPIKPLFRFKSVSKLWHSTLSSRHFAYAHLKYRHNSATESVLIRCNNKFTILFHENVDQIGSINDMNLDNMESYFNEGDEKLVMVGTCNGLVCLGSNSGRLFIILNPITREFRNYFYTEISKLGMVNWGFGYASAIDDYKIVRICKKRGSQSFMVDVFSLRLNRWRRIDNDPCNDLYDLRINKSLHTPGVLLNETLYWLGGIVIMGKPQWKVLAFDLGLEKFYDFPYLGSSRTSLSIMGDDYNDEWLCVVNGCLSKYGSLVVAHREIITIRKCTAPGMSKLFSFSSKDCKTCGKLIGFTGTDKIIIQYDGDPASYLQVIDPSSQPFKHKPLSTLEIESESEIASYSPSLISPIAVTTMIEDRGGSTLLHGVVSAKPKFCRNLELHP